MAYHRHFASVDHVAVAVVLLDSQVLGPIDLVDPVTKHIYLVSIGKESTHSSDLPVDWPDMEAVLVVDSDVVRPIAAADLVDPSLVGQEDVGHPIVVAEHLVVDIDD